ncbi:MAG TPA: hypothetical protein VH375_07930 [Rhodanobacteraceae bacterium]
MWTLRTVISLALVGVPALAPADTFRVGAGSGCTHATIQDAIDAAAADPDVADFIRVTRSITYDDIALDIHDQHLVITGGYANCLDETGDDQRTDLGGDGDHSVVRIHGYGDVVLRYLTLSGGHEPLFDYGYGGGVQIDGGPHLISLDHMFVTGNEAGHGGGISLRNTVNGDPNLVRLVLGDDVVVSSNHAEFPPSGDSAIQGGGVYCHESSIVWNGGGQTSIVGNTASLDGGGIGIDECDLTIAPHGSYGSFNGLVLNEAGLDGGGLAVEGHSGGGTKIYVTDSARPVYVAGNSAGREGGGIKINSDAEVEAWDLILDGNRAYGEGGGISVFCGSLIEDAFFTLRGDLSGAPADAVQCQADKGCNSISGNIAEDGSGQPQAAAAVRVKTNPGYGEYCEALARVLGTHIANNVGESVVRIYESPDLGDQGDSHAELAGTAITANDVSEAVLQTGVSETNDNYPAFTVKAATIAGNTVGGSDVISSHSGISIARSIIWQPGKRVLQLTEGSLDPGQIDYLLASDLTGIPASATNFIADPRFVDPELGDFHLHASSPAIDFAPSSGDPEADGAARSVNLALVPDDGFGPQDLGAYERQSIGNLVRNAEFDEDLHIWTNAAPAATSWYAYDHAGATTSGSLEVYDTSTATRVVGLSQCVGIPGPGYYRLAGYGWSWENVFPAVPDHPILGWILRHDSADCSGAPIGAGEAVTPTSGGWQPIPAQFIAVSDADWTPGTTVEIQLIQEKTDNAFGGDSDPILFDGIVLVPDSDRIFADGFDGN